MTVMLFLLLTLLSVNLVAANNLSPTLTSGSAPPQTPDPGCTTLQPLFGFPSDGTSTIFPTIVTATSTLDCRGCTPRKQLFQYSISDPPPSPTTTITNTLPITTFEISCIPTSSLAATFSSVPTAPFPSFTASPLPSISSEAQTLIDELRTVNLYVALIANGGFADVLCSAINPPLLSNNTGINGTTVQNEICFAAGVQTLDPPLFPIIVQRNQVALQRVAEVALFAVQVVGGYAGIVPSQEERTRLCDSVDEEGLQGLFVGFKVDEGKKIKKFICGT